MYKKILHSVLPTSLRLVQGVGHSLRCFHKEVIGDFRGLTTPQTSSANEEVSIACVVPRVPYAQSVSLKSQPGHTAAKDIPGKMKKLFTCPGDLVLPCTSTGGKRVPEPKIA